MEPIRLPNRITKRTLRQVIQDVWMAFRGRTFVSISGCCHKCDTDFHIEAYQDLNFPMTNGAIGIEYGTFNDVMYYPSLRSRYEDTGVIYETLSIPKHLKIRNRSHWKRPRKAKPAPLKVEE